MVFGHFRIPLYEERGKVTPPVCKCAGVETRTCVASFALASDLNAGLILSPFQCTFDTKVCVLNEGRLCTVETERGSPILGFVVPKIHKKAIN